MAALSTHSVVASLTPILGLIRVRAKNGSHLPCLATTKGHHRPPSATIAYILLPRVHCHTLCSSSYLKLLFMSCWCVYVLADCNNNGLVNARSSIWDAKLIFKLHLIALDILKSDLKMVALRVSGHDRQALTRELRCC